MLLAVLGSMLLRFRGPLTTLSIQELLFFPRPPSRGRQRHHRQVMCEIALKPYPASLEWCPRSLLGGLVTSSSCFSPALSCQTLLRLHWHFGVWDLATYLNFSSSFAQKPEQLLWPDCAINHCVAASASPGRAVPSSFFSLCGFICCFHSMVSNED